MTTNLSDEQEEKESELLTRCLEQAVKREHLDEEDHRLIERHVDENGDVNVVKTLYRTNSHLVARLEHQYAHQTSILKIVAASTLLVVTVLWLMTSSLGMSILGVFFPLLLWAIYAIRSMIHSRRPTRKEFRQPLADIPVNLLLEMQRIEGEKNQVQSKSSSPAQSETTDVLTKVQPEIARISAEEVRDLIHGLATTINAGDFSIEVHRHLQTVLTGEFNGKVSSYVSSDRASNLYESQMFVNELEALRQELNDFGETLEYPDLAKLYVFAARVDESVREVEAERRQE